MPSFGIMLLVLLGLLFTAPAISAGAIIGVAQGTAARGMCEFVEVAAANGVQLIAFAEGLVKQSKLESLKSCAKASRVNLVVPVSEANVCDSKTPNRCKNSTTTTYIISNRGAVLQRRRSVLDGHGGTGGDLRVVDVPGVGTVCTMLGDESYSILSRYAYYTQACQYMVVPTTSVSELWAANIQSIGREGRMYVMSVGQVAPSPQPDEEGMVKDGGAIIVDFEGTLLAGPVYSNCTLCTKQCKPAQPLYYSVAWAKANQCNPKSPNSRCGLSSVGRGGFVLFGKTDVGDVLASKTYQDNVGNYHHKWAWNVMWKV